jgi:sugar lactone lactonase YvrE
VRPLAGTLARLALLAGVGLSAGCGGDSTGPGNLDCSDPGSICTAVGTGVPAYRGEGAPPLEAALFLPIDISFDETGRLIILDWNNFRIRRVDADNRLRTIMGTGVESEVVNDKPALETPLHHTFSMARDGQGGFYLAGNHEPRILYCNPNGRAYITAGVHEPGKGGEDVPALEASFDQPCGVAVGPGGVIWVADTNNHRIRRIDADGMVTTIAGDGTVGYAGDGGPALAARFRLPYRIRYDAAHGDLYVCDTGNHAVRRIDANGVIHAVAGTGQRGNGADGQPAAATKIDSPYDVQVGPDGAVFIADSGNNRIRRIGPDGTMTTVAGTGIRGFTGDGGPAAQAELDYPSAIAFDADGDLWIADTYNNRIRVCPN